MKITQIVSIRIFLIMCITVAFWLLVSCQQSYAESYMGIGFLDTLGEVKDRFPNAKFERLKPAWAGPKDALYSITGGGINGSIVVKFYDSRTLMKKGPTSEAVKGFKQNVPQSTSDKEAMLVEWVRLVPKNLIPVQHILAKYGKPEKSGISDQDFLPYRKWVNKGIIVYISDTSFFVNRIDFSYTLDEKGSVCLEYLLPPELPTKLHEVIFDEPTFLNKVLYCETIKEKIWRIDKDSSNKVKQVNPLLKP